MADGQRGQRPRSDVGDGDLDLNAWLDGDRRDLFHDVRWGVEVNEALVDAHLPPVEGVGALTAWRLAHAEAQRARRKAHGARHMELLLLRARDQVGAHLLERLHVAARERDADA